MSRDMRMEAITGLTQENPCDMNLVHPLTGYAKFEIMENVTMENTLSLYSNYLDNPGNIDIDYLMNLEMSINKLLICKPDLSGDL